MAGVPFDTMATMRLLQESGIEERQAEAITAAIRDGVTGVAETRADMGSVSTHTAGITSEFARIVTDLKWIKLIAGAVLVVLVLQRLAELAAAMH
ncbi:MAG: hypothetical protein F4213_18675 [Boseongicola sp. SB0677_bin_26]|nr:hypothetical protein [Boseongicola sp. SB0665_bin_10]MYG28015.1 hypothetical protein [Boseongicola sp. SB0677_bin_26]